MVEIIKNGNTNEEKELEKRVLKLHGIACGLDIRGKITGYLDGDYINISGSMGVCCSENLIKLRRREDFDDALKLAKAYEKETGEKWKLKEMY